MKLRHLFRLQLLVPLWEAKSKTIGITYNIHCAFSPMGCALFFFNSPNVADITAFLKRFIIDLVKKKYIQKPELSLLQYKLGAYWW